MGVVEQIEAAGIVGCGGAGFPTHKKLTGDIRYFIVNGAECEPLLRTDRYLMRKEADRIVAGTLAVAKELKIPEAVIALKEVYREEREALQQAIDAVKAPVRLHLLESFYPAGDEQTICYEVTGKAVPPLGLPIAVGAVIDNVGTVCEIARALEGKTVTDKYLTVTGEVEHPLIVKAPIGTPLTECVRLAGGAKTKRFHIVTGGPMMGRDLDAAQYETGVVTKTTSSVLVLPEDTYHAHAAQVPLRSMLHRAQSACIQCSFCTQLCPRHLLGHPLEPHRIMRRMSAVGYSDDQPVARQVLEEASIQYAALCCECGICETYACPMGLRPRTINAVLKQQLAKAGLKCSVPEEAFRAVHPARQERKVPSRKAAARVGVLPYYDTGITDCVEAKVNRVVIPLKMHIGAPAVPEVATGDHVKRGERIASVPKGALGANIHASIDGRVTTAEDAIVIEA